MREVAIAFATTGPSPKKGHRMSELFAVEQLNGIATGRTIHLVFKSPDAQDRKATFSAQFDQLNELIGDAPIIVHHAGIWRKFMGIELREIKKRGTRRLLKQTVDVYRWAYQRYPKQRWDVAAIAKRLEIGMPAELTGLQATAEQLRLIARQIKSPEDAKAGPETPAAVAIAPKERASVQASLVGKLGALWRSLTG